MGVQHKTDSIKEAKIKSLEAEIAKSDSRLTECIEALVQNKMDVLYPKFPQKLAYTAFL